MEKREYRGVAHLVERLVWERVRISEPPGRENAETPHHALIFGNFLSLLFRLKIAFDHMFDHNRDHMKLNIEV